MSRLFDTHVHFDGITDGAGIEAVIERAVACEVTRMLAIGGDVSRNAFAVNCAATHPAHVRAVIGYDRDCAGEMICDEALDASLRSGTAIAAIGEIGLDFHYHGDARREQRDLFVRMLDVARQHVLPVVVHSREATDDTVALLREHAQVCGGAGERLGVLHCFTGDGDFARRLVDLGYYISFSGIVTFKNADALREACRIVPDERLLIETDSPYLSPMPHRGQPNEPARVPCVAAKLAEVRGTTADRIAAITFQNACRLFNWPD